MIIHRDTCPNVLKADPEQQLDASWDDIQDRSYRTQITVGARDAHGLLAAMASAISEASADIESVETPSQKQAGTEGFIEFKFFIKTKNLDHSTKSCAPCMPSRKCAALPAIDIFRSWHDLNRRSIVSLCPALKRATIFIGFDIKGRLIPIQKSKLTRRRACDSTD